MLENWQSIIFRVFWTQVQASIPLQSFYQSAWRYGNPLKPYERGYSESPARGGKIIFHHILAHKVTLKSPKCKPRYSQVNFWSLNTMRIWKNRKNHYKPLVNLKSTLKMTFLTLWEPLFHFWDATGHTGWCARISSSWKYYYSVV